MNTFLRNLIGHLLSLAINTKFLLTSFFGNCSMIILLLHTSFATMQYSNNQIIVFCHVTILSYLIKQPLQTVIVLKKPFLPRDIADL